MSCVACRQGFTWECAYRGQCDKNSNHSVRSVDSSELSVESSANKYSQDSEEAFPAEDSEAEGYVVNGQDDSKLKDQQSTGRKRAAKMYPLAEGAPCEWQGKKNCGGGDKPIVGCINGTQQARHHGPDKNTLNNEKGNVHRICHTCHNRWHTQNDEGYVWGSTYAAHSPVAADLTELKLNEVAWMTRTVKECKD